MGRESSPHCWIAAIHTPEYSSIFSTLLCPKRLICVGHIDGLGQCGTLAGDQRRGGGAGQREWLGYLLPAESPGLTASFDLFQVTTLVRGLFSQPSLSWGSYITRSLTVYITVYFLYLFLLPNARVLPYPLRFPHTFLKQPIIVKHSLNLTMPLVTSWEPDC